MYVKSQINALIKILWQVKPVKSTLRITAITSVVVTVQRNISIILHFHKLFLGFAHIILCFPCCHFQLSMSSFFMCKYIFTFCVLIHGFERVVKINTLKKRFHCTVFSVIKLCFCYTYYSTKYGFNSDKKLLNINA